MATRKRHPMPDDILESLRANNVLELYHERPAYQQNDYLGWITSAKQDATKHRRLKKMLAELKAGNAYMGMSWGKAAQRTAASPKPPRPRSLAAFMGKRSDVLLHVAGELNSCLVKTQPKFEQKVAWGGWAYIFEDNYSCMIVPYDDHVKLMIWRGVQLSDPKKLLKGSGSNTRHLAFFNANDIDCGYIKMLIKEQLKLYKQGLSWEKS